MRTVKIVPFTVILVLFTVMSVCVNRANADRLPKGFFVDVPKGHWSRRSINKLINSGFINGHIMDFKGEENIDRYKASIIISRLLDMVGDDDRASEVDREKL